MEFLLSREKNGTPELPAAQYPPVLVNPGLALAKIAGDLLDGHYIACRGPVNLWLIHEFSSQTHFLNGLLMGSFRVTSSGVGSLGGITR
jgi:hypothetical protein